MLLYVSEVPLQHEIVMLPLIFNLLAMLLIGLAFHTTQVVSAEGKLCFLLQGCWGKRSGDLQGHDFSSLRFQFVQAVILSFLYLALCLC